MHVSDFQWAVLIAATSNLLTIAGISTAGRCGVCGHSSVRWRSLAGRSFCPHCEVEVIRSRSQKGYLTLYALLLIVSPIFLLFVPHISWLAPYHYWLLAAFAILCWGGRFVLFVMPAAAVRGT